MCNGNCKDPTHRPPDYFYQLESGVPVVLEGFPAKDAGWLVGLCWSDQLAAADVKLGGVPVPNRHPGWIKRTGGSSTALLYTGVGSAYVNLWRIKP